MLVRPLLKRRPELAYHRQYVFIRPLTHYLRGVYFCPGRWANEVNLATFAMPLFGGWNGIYLAHGKGLARSRFPFNYDFLCDWQQDPKGTSQKVCDLIENEALPEIVDLTTPEAVAAQPGYNDHLEDKVLGPCFNGDYDETERAVDAYVKYWKALPTDRLIEKTKVGSTVTYRYDVDVLSTDRVTEEHKFSDHVQWRMTYLNKVLETDRSRIPQLLHDWEAFTVKALGLTKYWTPTPFPCER